MKTDLKNAINSCVGYIAEHEWNHIVEELDNGLQPNDTILWDALVVNHRMFGGTPPHEAFMEEIAGIEVSEEGLITNEY
jgi:hypothetical protein